MDFPLIKKLTLTTLFDQYLPFVFKLCKFYLFKRKLNALVRL